MALRKQLIQLYKHVCWLDVHALKPGNVSVYADAQDLKVDDFLSSAKASVEPITETNISEGEGILHISQTAYGAVGTNTNLGIILLISPLIQAIYALGDDTHIEELALRNSLERVLNLTTIEDAVHVYQAIRLMNPGGMGKKDDQDVSQEPEVSLLKTMQIASSWDQIAAQYSNNYEDVFNIGAPKFQTLMQHWQDEKWATTGLFMSFLSQFPDSLIERKHGQLKAKEISDMIRDLERDLSRSDLPGSYEGQLIKIDTQLKRDLINPGTTADLTAASIFASGLVN